MLAVVLLGLGGCSASFERAVDGSWVRYPGQPGVTALETLKSLTQVTTRETRHGEFVAAIGGVAARPDQFWAFTVNGELVREGAGTWRAEAGDVVEWRLTAIPTRTPPEATE